MKNLIVDKNISIIKAMKKLNESGQKGLIIVEDENLLMGTLTDGDIRKAILNGANISNSIDLIYNRKPTFLVEGAFSLEAVKKIFLERKFDLIPVVDKKGKHVDTLFWEKIFKKNRNKSKEKINVPVVIMAGGKGSRLAPFTNILPKPLVPVHNKPIIEHIIDRFYEFGCNNFYMTVNYKARILKAYFDELQPDYNMSFVDEPEPLGTAGCLRLLNGKFDEPFFVSNCDIIVKTNYQKIYDFHQKGGFDVTLVASTKEYIIPYGTCELNSNGHLSHINEKPQYNFLINTGLYILNPDILPFIPKNKFYHITHLIEEVKNRGKKVGVYPVDDEAWIDVGEWAEFKKATEKL
jgi:dTDP-glucose pyrophosphorylase/CBS domain-containing protein